MKISPARIAAYKILLRIEQDRAFSSVLLAEYEARLEMPERSLCHALVLGVLRNQLYLDVLIDLLAARKNLDPEIRIALRLGLFQIYFLSRVPSYAVISQTVELAGFVRKKSAKSLINAVLRRAAKSRPEIHYESEAERISVETSHPIWLIERWTAQYGIKRAEEIARAGNVALPAVFRLTRKATDSGYAVPDGSLPLAEVPGCFSAPDSGISLANAQSSGLIYFQNPASFLVAAAVDPPSNGRLIDVCAAPGSKATAISMLYGGRNISIIAGDYHRRRVDALKANATLQGASEVSVVRYDATRPLPFAGETFDTVLVDAPCSGTGTLASNPEIRYFLQPSDISSLAEKQLRILNNASKMLRRGGRLIYATCSLEFEEGEQVVGQFLAGEQSAFSIANASQISQFQTVEGFYRTMPGNNGMEGFFIAVLVKH